jgi:alpha-ketoglutarate-dependent taurine dioxygenase
MTVSGVALHDRWLRVSFDGGRPSFADFHYLWLRHNCSQDLHPATRERVVDASEISERIRPRDAWSEGESLAVAWDEPSGRVSRYDSGWLIAHAYAPERAAPPPPETRVEAITLDARREGAALWPRLIERVAQLGAARVVGFYPSSTEGDQRVRPEDTEVIVEALARAGLRVIGTHFGRIEDLRVDNSTNRNTDQLGYTDAAVHLHTDQPFLEHPPTLQALHCMHPAPKGGESFLVDARAIADLLRAEDADAWELLRTVPVTFHRKQKSFEKVLVSPVLSEDGPAGFRVRYSYFTLAPYRVPFAQMERWYRAHRRFAELVRAPEHHLRFTLGPGEFVLYDNHRMLHARTAFEGHRWLRGVYFDR